MPIPVQQKPIHVKQLLVVISYTVPWENDVALVTSYDFSTDGGTEFIYPIGNEVGKPLRKQPSLVLNLSLLVESMDTFEKLLDASTIGFPVYVYLVGLFDGGYKSIEYVSGYITNCKLGGKVGEYLSATVSLAIAERGGQ